MLPWGGFALCSPLQKVTSAAGLQLPSCCPHVGVLLVHLE